VKQSLSARWGLGLPSTQQLYLIDEGRSDEESDLELHDHETAKEIMAYSTDTQMLRLTVLLGLTQRNLGEFLQNLQANPVPKLFIGGGDKNDHNSSIARQINRPVGVAFVPAYPHLLLVTSRDDHKLRMFDSRMGNGWGLLLCQIGKDGPRKYNGKTGGGEGEFSGPWGVVVTGDSEFVIVADQNNHRLQMFRLIISCFRNQTAAHMEFVRMIGAGTENAIDSARARIPLATEFMRVIKPLGGGLMLGAGMLNFPRGLAIRRADNRETILVTENGHEHGRISEFTIDGVFVRTIGHGPGCMFEARLRRPNDVTTLALSGEIAVADGGNHRVCVFDGVSGSFVRSFGSWHTVEDKDCRVNCPTAIASDALDNIVVLDVSTSRVMVFTAAGEHLCTRVDLRLPKKPTDKGLAWNDAMGSLVIATGFGHSVCAWQ
jgi:hypothetical protein